jgi:hypothetical protein
MTINGLNPEKTCGSADLPGSACSTTLCNANTASYNYVAQCSDPKVGATRSNILKSTCESSYTCQNLALPLQATLVTLRYCLCVFACIVLFQAVCCQTGATPTGGVGWFSRDGPGISGYGQTQVGGSVILSCEQLGAQLCPTSEDSMNCCGTLFGLDVIVIDYTLPKRTLTTGGVYGGAAPFELYSSQFYELLSVLDHFTATYTLLRSARLIPGYNEFRVTWSGGQRSRYRT